MKHPRFTVIMPIKSLDGAKSRLHVEAQARQALAMSFARDTLEAVLCCPEVRDVVVVTGGEQVAKLARDAGAQVLQEPVDSGPDPLGAAVRQGNAWAREHRPHDAVAVIPSDLPALTSSALSGFLLEAVSHPLAFAADASGDGTTILTSQLPDLMHAGYGVGSAERHRAYGAYELTAADPVLRRDVDVFADLLEARGLGLGPNTQRSFQSIAAAETPHERFAATSH